MYMLIAETNLKTTYYFINPNNIFEINRLLQLNKKTNKNLSFIWYIVYNRKK